MRIIYVLLLLTGMLGAVAYADYLATQPASGTSFGSFVFGGTHYPRQITCDGAVPTQCASVSGAGSLATNNNVATWAGTALGLPTLWGTAPSGANVIGTNANVLNIGFLPGASNNVSVSNAGSTGVAVPSPGGPVAAIQNTGTNPVSCILATGISAAATNQLIIQSGSSVAISTVGVTTPTVNCINQSGTNTNVVVVTVGSGLYSGVGGGAGTIGAVNVSQWGGNTVGTSAYGTAPSGQVPGFNAFVTNSNANGQALKSGSSPVVLASDQFGDPCSVVNNKSNIAYSFTTGTQLLVGSVSGSNHVYMCSFSIMASTAGAFSVVEGGSTVCTSPAAVIGGITGAAGLSLQANGGMTLGSGSGTVAKTATLGNSLCILQTAGPQLAGNATYVMAP
jgi:hypothetical protein